MRRRLYLLALCCLLAPVGWGQGLLWQRRFAIGNSREVLTDAVTLEDQSVLAIGASSRVSGACLFRFTSNGDTLYRSALPSLSASGLALYSPRICRLSSGAYFATGRTRGIGDDTTTLVRIDPENGQELAAFSLQGVGPGGWPANVNRLIEGPNGTLVLAADCADSFGQAVSVGYLACYDTLGVLQWDTIIREHPRSTYCHHVEMTRDGNILVSGTAGSRIWAAEYAHDGFEIRRATFSQSQGRINFDYNPTVSVRQAPGNRYVVSGNTQQFASYLGLHQGWGGPRLWGGETRLCLRFAPQVNQDGSVAYFEQTTTTNRLARLRTDSTLAWRQTLPLQAMQEGLNLYAFAALADSSAIAVGSAVFADSTSNDWYAARITNMGIPYRPWQPTVATRAKASQPAPKPYPSPCSNTLRFAGLAGPCHVRLYGTDGRLHLEQTLAPGQTVDVAALPAGVYGYVLQGAGKVWRGRVVKR